MKRMRLSGSKEYLKDIVCENCGQAIIVQGIAISPIYYILDDKSICIECSQKII